MDELRGRLANAWKIVLAAGGLIRLILPLARQRPVEIAMVEFKVALEATQPRSAQLPRSELEQPALRVAKGCRASLTAHWQTGIRGLFGGALTGVGRTR
jgi:hypothetical protein